MVFLAQHVASIADTHNGGFGTSGHMDTARRTSHLFLDFLAYKYWKKSKRNALHYRSSKFYSETGVGDFPWSERIHGKDTKNRQGIVSGISQG